MLNVQASNLFRILLVLACGLFVVGVAGADDEDDDEDDSPVIAYPYFTSFEKGPTAKSDDDKHAVNAEWRVTGTWNIVRGTKTRPSLSGAYLLDNNPKSTRIAGRKRPKSFTASIKRPINIPSSAVSPVLRFYHQLTLGTGETVSVQLRTAGNSAGLKDRAWTTLKSYTRADNTSGYVEQIVPLSLYKGDDVRIRFVQTSGERDLTVVWLIDDVLIGEATDRDGDGIPDYQDPDRDGDGISNDYEIQAGTNPDDPSSVPPDLDRDGIPDALDGDRDGDNVANAQDAFPDNPAESSDIDRDGIGDNADTDRDGDGISNDYETQVGTNPNDPASVPVDANHNGIPDVLENTVVDRDGDGVPDQHDAFPDDPTESADLDKDGIGDNKDPDRDGDGISNDYETQAGTNPNDATSAPPDMDKDGIPDVLDQDRDGDGVENNQDLFPDNAAEWADTDGDGVGNNADTDRDGDGVPNSYELIVGTNPDDPASVPSDMDKDGIPDALDGDIDGDGVANEGDAFPEDKTEWSDLDADGIGDNKDPDRDGDGINNVDEVTLGTNPDDPESVPPDLDKDGIPDALDDDRDGDGVLNAADVFPNDPSETTDLDNDGIGDNADPDRDGDGISNDHETQLGTDPNNKTSVPPDFDHDGMPDALDDDRDGDNVPNAVDAFPDNPVEWADLDHDGIGDNADPDRDGDGISNADELALGTDPNSATSVPTDADHDGTPDALDADRDGDGVANDQDTYPDDATRSALAAVTGLYSTLVAQSVRLGWSPLADSAKVSGYRISRNNAGATPSQLTTVAADAREYTDGTVSNGSGYEYRVTALDLNGKAGATSDPLAVFVAYNETPVTGLQAQRAGADVSLGWQAVSGMRYQIFRGTLNATPQALAQSTSASYTDKTAVWSSAFTYQVATIASFTDSFTGAAVEIIGPRSEIATVDALPPLTLSVDDAAQTGATTWQRVVSAGSTIAVTARYTQAVGAVQLRATSGSQTVSAQSSDGTVRVSLPGTPGSDWTLTLSETLIPDRSIAITLRLVADTTAPAITIDGAAARSTTEAQIQLTGVATDDNGVIATLQAHSDRYTGQTFGALQLDGGRFSTELPLQYGANALRVVATDGGGNPAEARVNVERAAPLTPSVLITAPLNGATVTTSRISVNGAVYSSLTADQLRVTLGTASVTPTATAAAGVYSFQFENVALVQGANALRVVVDSPAGSGEATTLVAYSAPATPTSAPAPAITITYPANTDSVSVPQLIVAGTATSTVGLVSVRINGAAMPLPSAQSTTVNFQYPVDFAAMGVSDVTLTITAQDTQGKTTSKDFVLRRDADAPLIAITTSGILSVPSVNRVVETPFRFEGTVSDASLAGFTINGEPVGVVPGADAQTYRFSINLALPLGQQQSIALHAWDAAGNETAREVILLADAPARIELISPAEGSEFMGLSAAVPVSVVARVTGLPDGAHVDVATSGQAPFTMALDHNVANATVSLAPGAEHTITVRVLDTNSAVVTQSSRKVNVIDANTLALELVKTSPANGANGVEPNQFIALHFNRAIDPALLAVTVRETAHGLTWDMSGQRGIDPVTAGDAAKLIEVHRDREVVEGRLSTLPGDTSVAYNLVRDLAYGANVYVEVSYNGSEVTRLSYAVRPLPTFLQGVVLDQLGQPVSGMSVTLPDADVSTTTDSEGAFAFGFGLAASQALPSGRQRIVFNPGLKNRSYGSFEDWTVLQPGRHNRYGVRVISALSPNIPFQSLNSGTQNSLTNGELTLDLTRAQLTFPDGRNRGEVHVQFTRGEHMPYKTLRSALATWYYGMQPAGIRVSGATNLSMAIPLLRGSDAHIPPENTPVLIVGVDDASKQVVPVGVGRVQNRRVVSAHDLDLTRMEYLGYVTVGTTQQAVLEEYLRGALSLPQLISRLEAGGTP